VFFNGKERVSITTETKKTPHNKKNPDKSPSKINPDLMHRQELEKKKAIHPSAMHG